MSLRPGRPPILPGYRLDRYEFLCPIAEGGMASVWMARLQGKHGFEKLVAIKTILPKLSSDEMFQQMFLDEARISAGIEHTNVAQILDLGDDRGILYLVMEWVDGDSVSKLLSVLAKKQMVVPHGIALRILADTCGGLHAAHELRGKDGASLGVVHRDVSPQNILVAVTGVAKVIDFGIAKARDRLVGETSAGLLKGKVQYMAPEQAFGKATDRRADIWAVGAVLYHLVSGRAPFNGANQLATLHMLTSGQPPAPLPPSVPAPLRKVIAKALSHDPSKRFETAIELQRALERTMLETGLTTTTSDVAAFCAEHFVDRASSRREAIELALSAASERARVEGLLQASSHEMESQRIDAKGTTLAPMPLPSDLFAIEDVPISIAPPAGDDALAVSSGRLSSLSDALSATMTATMTPSAPGIVVPKSGKRWAVLGAAAAVAVVIGIGLSVRTGPHAPAAAGASAAVELLPATAPIEKGATIETLSGDRAPAPPGPEPSPPATATASPPPDVTPPASVSEHAPKTPDVAARPRPQTPAPIVSAQPARTLPAPNADKGLKKKRADYGF